MTQTTSQVVITAVGPDRPGIVGDLSGYLHERHANILDSRMVNLRGHFALLLLLEATAEAMPRLREGLPALAAKMGLTLSTTEQTLAAAPRAGLPMRLKTYSMDQPGIVSGLSALLQKHEVNIEELETRQESGAFMGAPLFILDARITVPPTISVRTLRAELERLADSLNCDVDLDPA